MTEPIYGQGLPKVCDQCDAATDVIYKTYDYKDNVVYKCYQCAFEEEIGSEQ